MKKTRKIIAILLTVLTLMSVISAATPVFAEDVTELTETESENATTEASETEAIQRQSQRQSGGTVLCLFLKSLEKY